MTDSQTLGPGRWGIPTGVGAESELRSSTPATRSRLRARGLLRRGSAACRSRADNQSQQRTGAELPGAGASLDGEGRRGAGDLPEHAWPGPAGTGRGEHRVRTASAWATGRKARPICAAHCGITRTIERQSAGDAGAAARVNRLDGVEDELIASIGQRKTANPSHHAAYFAACASGASEAGIRGCSVAAGSRVDWVSCYSLFARDPNLDPIRSDPDFQGFMAELQKSSASLRRTLFPTASSLAVFAQCFFGVCSIQYTGVNSQRRTHAHARP